MIRGYIPGFARPKEEYRYGDAQVITDGVYTLVIDGMCGDGTTKLIKWLKKNNYKKLWLIITHWHDDHFVGCEKILGDSFFSVQRLWCPNPSALKVGLGGYYSKMIQNCIDDGERVVALAKKKKVKVTHPISGTLYHIGDIRFKLYKQQPKKVAKDDTNAWEFVNNGSLGAWFPDFGYWTSGDGCGVGEIRDRLTKLGLKGKVKWFKIDHHGNKCSQSNAKFLFDQGAKYCWYNDLEPKGVGTTGFTAYGAKRCKEAGIHVFESVGDINWIAKSGKITIYKNFKSYAIPCAYKGKSTLKGANRAVAKEVIDGKYGSSNTRITNLIDAGYYPIAIQNLVNKMLKE